MGVCCSKNDVVKLKNTSENKSDKKTLLLQENVGEASKLNGTSTLEEANHPHIPMIQELGLAETQETEAVNSFNKEDQSAARSTLIFPSYTGYRNQDRFGINKKSADDDYTPTALVTPVQANNLLFGDQADNPLTEISTPLPSRYSPMLRKDQYYRSRPGAFDPRVTPARKGSVESRGFDSDLDSSSDEEIPDVVNVMSRLDSEGVKPNSLNDDFDVMKEITSSNDKTKQTSDIGISTGDGARSATLLRSPVTTQQVSDNAKQTTTSAGMQTADEFAEMVDASVGTDSDKFYRSKKTTKVQVDLKKKQTKTSSVSAGTDTVDLETPGKKLTHNAMVGTEPVSAGTASSKTPDTGTKTKSKKTYVKMVDASVGTDSDKFYRSKKTTKVQVDLKKKQTKTCSVSAGTDTGFDFANNKTTHDMMVGTEPETSISKPTGKNHAGTGTDELEAYVKMVDASVGTDSDKFYRSKTPRKVRVDKKKKKMATLSTGIGTNTGPSPNLLHKPKIVTEIQVTPPKKRRAVKTNISPTPSRIPTPEIKEEQHPIIETLENAFMRFAKYGDINGDGMEMNNKNWAKLCRDCEFINNKHVLVGEIDVIFSRHKQKGYRLINFEMFLNCLNEIADKTYSHKIKNEWARRELIYQRVIGKAPELVGITNISKTGNVDRMTDHHLYPVSHKMRFDEEGKGTGIEEKFEIQDSHMGYVQGYKDRDTYDSKLMGLPRERSGINMTSSRLPSPRSPRRPHSSQSIRN